MKANKNLTSLSDFIDQERGPKGTKEREEFEAGYEIVKLAVILQQARRQNALAQLRRRYDELDKLTGQNAAERVAPARQRRPAR